MKRILKPAALLLLAVLIIIQFIRPKKNTYPFPAANDISEVYYLHDTLHRILQRSCYDCHSNNTKYPWYANIQPVAWWLEDHVTKGKKDLNFSEFAIYSIRKKYRKLEEITELVKNDEMPLSSYTLIHRDAKLSQDQKQCIITWANAIKDTIENTYPADSLVRK